MVMSKCLLDIVVFNLAFCKKQDATPSSSPDGPFLYISSLPRSYILSVIQYICIYTLICSNIYKVLVYILDYFHIFKMSDISSCRMLDTIRYCKTTDVEFSINYLIILHMLCTKS